MLWATRAAGAVSAPTARQAAAANASLPRARRPALFQPGLSTPSSMPVARGLERLRANRRVTPGLLAAAQPASSVTVADAALAERRIRFTRWIEWHPSSLIATRGSSGARGPGRLRPSSVRRARPRWWSPPTPRRTARTNDAAAASRCKRRSSRSLASAAAAPPGQARLREDRRLQDRLGPVLAPIKWISAGSVGPQRFGYTRASSRGHFLDTPRWRTGTRPDTESAAGRHSRAGICCSTVPCRVLACRAECCLTSRRSLVRAQYRPLTEVLLGADFR